MKLRSFFTDADGFEYGKDYLPEDCAAAQYAQGSNFNGGLWAAVDVLGEQQRGRSRGNNKISKPEQQAATSPLSTSPSPSPPAEKRSKHDGSEAGTASGQEGQEGWDHPNLLMTAKARANVMDNTGTNVMRAVQESSEDERTDQRTASGQEVPGATHLAQQVVQELRLIRQEVGSATEAGNLARMYDGLCGCIQAGRIQEALQMLDMPQRDQLVKQCDVGGLTALHRAARLVSPEIVRRILFIDPQQASITTYASRAPGLWTPLMCMVEASTPSGQDNSDRQEACARMLINAMSEEALHQQNTSGNTAFHLAVNRGKHVLLDICLDACWQKISSKDHCCCCCFPNPIQLIRLTCRFKVEFA